MSAATEGASATELAGEAVPQPATATAPRSESAHGAILGHSLKSQVPEHVIIPEQLLLTMHEAGIRFRDSDEGVLHWWGVHLLEDWKSLYLLAERQRY